MKARVLVLVLCTSILRGNGQEDYNEIWDHDFCDCFEDEISPVCGQDEMSYVNKCEADCVNIAVMCEGECPCQEDDHHGSHMNQDCGCYEVYDPVCGSDGTTYSNECEISCLGVGINCQGECPCQKICVCDDSFRPVCGTDGKTHDNDCVAINCHQVDVACVGECPCSVETDEEFLSAVDDCACPRIYDPVCGFDGTTYGNECEAECAKEQYHCATECPCPVCECPEYLDWVCGENDVSYQNECFAGCNRIPISCSGQCPCEICNCEEIWDPVCGADGVTYSNECQAQCEGVQVSCNLECPC